MANMSDKVAEISDPTHHASFMISLLDLINTDSLVDVQFICQGGHKVFAHKLMLISTSGLLRELFKANPDSNEMITVHLPDINSKLLRIVINFLYIGSTRLNNAEMNQFKSVLGLLDIELYQKPSEKRNTSSEVVVCKQIANKNVSPTVVNPCSSSSNSSVVYNQQPVRTECAPMLDERSRITNLPAENRMQQYFSLQTDQLVSGNPGEVLIPLSALPIVSGANNMVVQRTIQDLPSPAVHQETISRQSQFNTFTNNTQNTSAHTTNNAILQSPRISEGMSRVASQQIPAQQTMVMQPQGQQIIHYVPNQESKTVNNNTNISNHNFDSSSNILFSNSPSTSTCSGTIMPPKPGIKRKSSHFVSPSVPNGNVSDVIDLSEDDESTLKVASVCSLSESYQNNNRKQKKHSRSFSSLLISQMTSNNESSSRNSDTISYKNENINRKEVIDLEK